MMPPMAARAEPMQKVKDMTRSTSMPMSLAVSTSLEQARMDMPVMVLFTRYTSAIKRTAVTTGMITDRLGMDMPRVFITPLKISGLKKDLGLPPNTTMATFSKKKDTPMADIKRDIRGAFLLLRGL